MARRTNILEVAAEGAMPEWAARILHNQLAVAELIFILLDQVECDRIKHRIMENTVDQMEETKSLLEKYGSYR